MEMNLNLNLDLNLDQNLNINLYMKSEFGYESFTRGCSGRCAGSGTPGIMHLRATVDQSTTAALASSGITGQKLNVQLKMREQQKYPTYIAMGCKDTLRLQCQSARLPSA